MIKEQKKNLRNEIQSRLQQLEEETIKIKSRNIQQTLMKLPLWKRAGMLMTFYPMAHEVDTRPLMKTALLDAKLTALPRINSTGMNFHILPPNTLDSSIEDFLERHPYGFLQPKEDLPLIRPSSHLISIIIVPGLGFDRTGNRLGRGKGFYDAYLAEYGQFVHSIGVCFDEQLQIEIPISEQDKKIRALISDSGIIF